MDLEASKRLRAEFGDYNPTKKEVFDFLKQDKINQRKLTNMSNGNLKVPTTAKVVSSTGAGTYQEMFTFEYTFDDGVIMKVNHKTNAPRFQQGDPVIYTINFQNHHGNLGSIDRPQDQNTTNNNPPPQQNAPTARVNVDDSILYQVSLKVATFSLIEMHDPQFAQSTITGKSINDLALEIAQVAKANIKKLSQ